MTSASFLDEFRGAAKPVRIAQNCSRPSFAHTHCGDRLFDSGRFEKIQRHTGGTEEGPLAAAVVSARHGRRESDGPQAPFSAGRPSSLFSAGGTPGTRFSGMDGRLLG